MGRPFAEELAELESTHRWACEFPIDEFADAIGELSGRSVLTVGSGGSFTTAASAAYLLRYFFPSELAFAVTPQDLLSHRAALRDQSVLVATASGSNPDAIGSLKTATLSEARSVLGICTKVGSKLGVEAEKFSNSTVYEFPLPSEGDGFLATNSLWASVVLLTRAMAQAGGARLSVSKRLSKIVGASAWSPFLNKYGELAAQLWERDSLIVLYGPTSYPAAVDMESKLTEAALANVWIADYRHFAHGRHHWLAKRRSETSVLAFIDESESALAQRTLAELPDGLPIVTINVQDGPLGMLRGLAHVFPMIATAGEARGIDPGRPGVPAFGRRIYHLNAYGKLGQERTRSPELAEVAIERKSNASMDELDRRNTADIWRAAYDRYVRKVLAAKFAAIVFDYDGTLCDREERFIGLKPEVIEHLNRLLASGLTIAFATGRGKSVRESLRHAIKRQHWDKIVVGYYNGGDVGRLNNDASPDGTHRVLQPLQDIWAAIESNSRLAEIAKSEGRPNQITVTAKADYDSAECWQLVLQLGAVVSPGKLKVVRSSHSFDLLPANVSKVKVVEHLSDLDGEVLAVGDMGRWPGNDFELLAHPYSLSVDEVSPDPDSCWNLSRPGVRGRQATIELVSRITVNTKGLARLKLPQGSRELKR
ncbi:MAG: HAD hydrolase family protein [Planctomycetaceae bacterium]